jgi:hypothetical protein
MAKKKGSAVREVKLCRARMQSESAMERCELRSGHKGRHQYTCTWFPNGTGRVIVSWWCISPKKRKV